MRRISVGAAALVLCFLLGTSAAHAAALVDRVTLHRIGETARQRPSGGTPVQLAGGSDTGDPSAQGSFVSAAGVSQLLSTGFETRPVPLAVYGPGWAITPYRKSEGSFSAYCAGMFIPPPGPYVEQMESWLIAGPFDLSEYESAELAFDVWADCEPNLDLLGAGASADGFMFDVVEYSGTTDGAWVRESIDISDYCGSAEVWIAFVFISDDANELEGAYIDRVALNGTQTTSTLNPVYRFYNASLGTHFYTPSLDERNKIISTLSNVYSYDGVAYWTSPYNNTHALYRFFNRKNGGHFYTASEAEATMIRGRWPDIYRYEGRTYAVSPWQVPDSIPVFRFYNVRNGTHFYTASESERDMVNAKWAHIYRYEGVAFWVGQAGAAAHEPAVAPGDPIPDTLWQPPADVLPETSGYVYLDSDPGDYIGAGQDHLYTPADAVITVTASGRHLSVDVSGEEQWSGDFELPEWLTELEPGYFPNLSRYPSHDAYIGGMSWSGEGRSSFALTAWCFIDSVTYTDGALTAVDLRFEQHSGGADPALRGKIRWRADDPTRPPGPVTPIPDGLWRPDPAALPDTGNYIYLDSEPGDYVGAGREYLYTQADAIISVGRVGGRVDVRITGDEDWRGTFQAMSGVDPLEVGYYPDLTRYPFNNPAKGGLTWSGESRGSSTLTGWFVVDSIAYEDGVMTAVDLRFEQHCEGAVPALRGSIHWRADDPTVPPGPVYPVPDTLWQPTGVSLPDTGNYIYLDSDPGDWVGAGREYLYTQADAILSVVGTAGKLSVMITGDEDWNGTFEAMSGVTQLQPGYYPDLMRWPFNNPVKGGMSWGGEGRGSNTLAGWFAIDEISYTNGVLTAIDVRFEQHTAGAEPALHGKIHWRAGDPTCPPGPILPIPDTLWQPADATLPETGNYVYLDSDPGDYVGKGREYMHTQADAVIEVASAGRRLDVTVNGAEVWYGDFKVMDTIDRPQVGYYPGIQRYPFHNPVKGGMDWRGPGASLTLTGWFVIDDIAYTNGVVTALDLRFEQHSGGVEPALRGVVHWRAE